jgi:hypothetical protein
MTNAKNMIQIREWELDALKQAEMHGFITNENVRQTIGNHAYRSRMIDDLMVLAEKDDAVMARMARHFRMICKARLAV